MTPGSVADRCRFTTERLDVADWHRHADARDLALVEVVMRLLTPTTTGSLPPEWHGGYDRPRAQRWIAARDAESPTLLALDVDSGEPVGLVILFDLAGDDRSGVDLRLGYLIAEDAWGRGYATELVQGLVCWAQDQSSVATITGGVAVDNPASAAVLVKAGFTPGDESERGERLFEYRFDRRR